MGQHQQAQAAFEKGFLLEPSNKTMRQALEKATAALGQGTGSTEEAGEESAEPAVGPRKPKMVKKELSPGISYMCVE